MRPDVGTIKYRPLTSENCRRESGLIKGNGNDEKHESKGVVGKMKKFMLFDYYGNYIYSKQMEDAEKDKFLNDSKKALEKYAYDNGLSANAILVNLAVYGGTGYRAEIDEWLWYSFLTKKFFLTQKQALEEEEK